MNDFQFQVWENNYKAPEDKTVQDTFLRVAKAVASVQKDKETRQLLTKQYYRIMSQWKFIPGGRILANAGVSERNKATLYNCYVYHPYDFGIKDIDSMEGIFQTLKKSAKILASQGGLGLNLSFIRPNGSYIAGTGARTPGVIKFMELWDKASDIITMGSNKIVKDKFSTKAKKKIRKGAMLCFSKNTVILTDKGWQPILIIIDKLQRGEEVNCLYSDGSSHKAKNPVINEPSQIYIIQSQDGTKLECTADHKFQVFSIQTGEIYLKALYEIQPKVQMLTIIDENMKKQYKALVSIKEKGLKPSYDFQIQDVHRIIAKCPNSKNAFLTSNCAMDISHPQIKDFITAKQISNHLTKFNLSVLVSDRFMKAVENNEIWKLCFPDIQYKYYKQEWDGNLEEWISRGKPVTIYEEIPAKDLWDLIMISSYNRNQPGILFYDTINNYNPVGYCQKIITTNPCLSGDTLIAIANNQKEVITIRELAENKNSFLVFSLENNKITIKDAIAFKTKENAQLVKVILDDGSYFKCTPDHKIMLENGNYCQAIQLKENDILMPVNDQTKVVRIEKCENQDVYDIHVVSQTHNFAIITNYENNNKGIFVHNCGEIPQPSNVCNLGSLNLVQFFKNGEFDWQDFQKVIKLAVCFLDDVIDISFVPLNEYEQKIRQKRRIGLGVMGLGSLLMMMKLKFGSYEAIQFVDKLFKFKSETQLMTSAVLGKLKGSFLAFDSKKYFSSNWWYELPLNYKTKRQIEEIGQMRNSVHSDTAPTGNCVVKETKIFTEQGIKTIQEIFKENQIILNQNINYWYIPKKQLQVQTLDGFQKITGLYNNGKGKVYSIKTTSGKCIVGTEQHKILKDIKYNEVYWINLSQLKVKDKILVYLNYNYFQKEVIQSIETYDDFTYDLEVQDSHHYILNNGIVSHNSSIFAGQVSNGIQPVFMKQYTRWVVMNNQQKEILQKRHYCLENNILEQIQEIPIDTQYQKIPDPQLGQWWQTSIFKFANRGNQQILRGQIDGVTYEIDKNRGLIKPIQVVDYGWKYVKQNIQSDNYDWCVTTNDLTIEDHINMLSASAKYIDQNQSKTINIPENYSYQNFKNVYISAWKRKIKGLTTYRVGTMTAVLQGKKKTEEYQSQLEKLFKENNGDIIFQDVKIPDKSYALQYKIKDKNNKKWYFTVSFADKELTKPFAFFIRTNNRESNEVADLIIQAMEELLLSLGIREQLIAEQRQKYKQQTNVDKIGRAIGMALRHNVPIVKIVETLNNYNDGLSTLLFHIKRILSGFIKDGTKINGAICQNCGSTDLVYQSGCSTCNNCGGSKCS